MSGDRKVRHIVLVKFKSSASEKLKSELIRLSQWGKKAAYVSSYTSGHAINPNPYSGQTEEWDWGMSLDLLESDVTRYRDDPVHQSIPAEVIDSAEKFAILDFIIDEPKE